MSNFTVTDPKGSNVHFFDEDGQILRSIRLPPGIYSTASFEKLRHPGEKVSYDVPVYRGVGNCRTIKCDGHEESAANPFFRMTPAARQARELRRVMARTEALAAFTRKGLKALHRAKRETPRLESPQVQAEKPQVEAPVSTT